MSAKDQPADWLKRGGTSILKRGGDSSRPAESGRELAILAEVCNRVASGDLEARVPNLGAAPGAEAARTAVNRLLDVTDAYVRESGAALAAAAAGRYHRRFLAREIGRASCRERVCQYV